MCLYIRIVILLLVVLGGTPVTGFGAEMIGNPNQSNGPIARIPLHAYGDFSRSQEEVHIQFSPTGERLCLWWPKDSQDARFPSRWLVLGTNGVLISSWTNRVVDDLNLGFPTLFTARKWRDCFTNTTAHAMDKDGASCVRAFPATDYNPPHRPTCGIEMIRLGADSHSVWRKELKNFHNIAFLAFLPHVDGTNLIVGFKGSHGFFLDAVTGSTISDFTYGSIESDEAAVQRKKKFRLKYSDDDPALRFSAGVFAFDSGKRLLAVGGFHDCRVRVLSLVAPVPVLFEANTDKNPQIPRGGSWQVHWLDFVASGKYLVVEYFFAGRGTDVVLRPTEIFETEHWQKVWQVDDRNIHSITVSPDGTMIALIRKNVLEIRPFCPDNR